MWARIEQHAEAVRDDLGPHPVAVVLGTGWSALAELLGPVRGRRGVDDLDGFPRPSLDGHTGELVSVDIDGIPTLVVAGRCHLYEGRDATEVVHAVRVAVLAGARTVVLTNAAGSLWPDLAVGAPVLISDHLNLTGTSPLVGPAARGCDDRFVDLGDLYSARLRSAARTTLGSIAEGVYAGVLGPQFETPAEIRALATLGADLVGMSTVLEAIAAAHLGAEVAGVSLVTNPAAGLTDRIDHDRVLETAGRSLDRLVPVVRALTHAAVLP